MESPVGKIISIGEGKATVAVERTAACPRCAAGKGCGAGLLSGSRDPAVLEVSLSPQMNVGEGDEVRLVLEPAHLLRASLLVYGLPLAGIALVLAAAWLLARPLSDPEAIAYACVGLAAGFIAGRWRLNRSNCLKQFVPRIEGTVDAATGI